MKKLLCLTFILVFVFSLFSCNEVPKTTESQDTQMPVSTEAAEKFKVFSDFVNDNLKFNDDGSLSFLHLTKALTYNTPSIEDSLSVHKKQIIADAFSVMIDEYSTGSGLSVRDGKLGEHFAFSEEYHIYNDGSAVNSAKLFITEYVGGMDFPFGITFDDKIDSALKTLTGLDVSFTPDEGSDTDMTLYSNGDEVIIYSNLNAIQAPVDYLNPYRIIYTNKYTYTNKNGIEMERTEKVSLNFDTFDNTLCDVTVDVEDYYNIPVNSIPTPTLITDPTPTEPSEPDTLPGIATSKALSTGEFGRVETWPMEDNGVWNARAFYDLLFYLDASEGDYWKNAGTDEYEYTW